MGFPGGTVVKNPSANAGDTRDVSSITGQRRYPGIINGNPLQYFCLENSMDRGAWQAAVLGGCKELNMTKHTHMHNMHIKFTILIIFKCTIR